jgi:hypothetical protein
MAAGLVALERLERRIKTTARGGLGDHAYPSAYGGREDEGAKEHS